MLVSVRYTRILSPITQTTYIYCATFPALLPPLSPRFTPSKPAHFICFKKKKGEQNWIFPIDDRIRSLLLRLHFPSVWKKWNSLLLTFLSRPTIDECCTVRVRDILNVSITSRARRSRIFDLLFVFYFFSFVGIVLFDEILYISPTSVAGPTSPSFSTTLGLLLSEAGI